MSIFDTVQTMKGYVKAGKQIPTNIGSEVLPQADLDTMRKLLYGVHWRKSQGVRRSNFERYLLLFYVDRARIFENLSWSQSFPESAQILDRSFDAARNVYYDKRLQEPVESPEFYAFVDSLEVDEDQLVAATIEVSGKSDFFAAFLQDPDEDVLRTVSKFAEMREKIEQLKFDLKNKEDQLSFCFRMLEKEREEKNLILQKLETQFTRKFA